MLDINKWSYWERDHFLSEIDIAIIGAGIVGYSTALRLKALHPTAKIVVIERGNLPSGASSKNAGFACFGSATELYDDLQNNSEKEVWSTVKLRWEGLSALRELISDENLGLKTHGSWDLITNNELALFEKVKPLIPHFNAKLKEITGVPDVFSIDSEVSKTFGFESVQTSFYNSLEGQINTGKMNAEFHKKIVAADIRTLFSTEVENITESTENVSIQTSRGAIIAQKVAVCTNGFARNLLPDEDVLPARAQVVITSPIPGLKIEGTFHYQEGYYYFRNIDNRLLFGGGRNLDKTGETTTKIENSALIIDELKHLLSTVILPNTPYEIEMQWAGIMGVGKTKKPIIKQLSERLFCGVRLGGMGVAIGTLVGKQLAELILEKDDL